MLVRQGHPGPRVPAYRSFADKQQDAVAHRRNDGVPWPVLADNVDGDVHRAYGMLADPTFLIDADGRIAFYNVITHAPTLHRALCHLEARGWRGIALNGFDRRIHALPIVTGGWPAIRRGLAQSAVELETALPGSAVLPFVGYHLRGLLAPLTQRGTPLPHQMRCAIGLCAVATIGALAAALAARPRTAIGA